MRRALLGLIFEAALVSPAPAAAAQAPTVVQHVRLMRKLEPNPYGGTLPIPDTGSRSSTGSGGMWWWRESRPSSSTCSRAG
jgi:hypothetical protein